MPTLVVIRWRDAHFDFDQRDDPHEDYLVETVGWILERGDRFLTVAGERLPHDDGFRAVSHIPLVCIVTETIVSAYQTAADIADTVKPAHPSTNP